MRIKKKILEFYLKEALTHSGILLEELKSVSVNRNPNNKKILWITIELDAIKLWKDTYYDKDGKIV